MNRLKTPTNLAAKEKTSTQIISFMDVRRSGRILTLGIVATLWASILHNAMGKEFSSQEPSGSSSLAAYGQGNLSLQDPLKALSSSNPYERQRAALALGTAGNTKAVEPLIKALQSDSDDFVRDFSARALGNIGDPRAVDPLIKALGDKHLLVRISAVKALANLRDSKAVDPLINVLESDEVLAQRAAAEALGQLGGPRVIDPLIKALGNDDSYVQNGAVNGLAKVGEPAIPKLATALGEWKIAPRAAEVLKDLHWQPTSEKEKVLYDIALRNRQSLITNWENVKRVLVNDAESENAGLSLNAVLALIGIGRDDVVDTLVGVLSKKGNTEMADAFLYCGNDRLAEAARSWSRERGMELKRDDKSPVIQWGEMTAASNSPGT